MKAGVEGFGGGTSKAGEQRQGIGGSETVHHQSNQVDAGIILVG